VVTLRFPADGSVLDTSLDLAEPSRVVVFGPNGAGKTTLLRLLAGTLPHGPSLESAYLPQTPYVFRGTAGWNLGLGLDAEEAARAAHLANRLRMSERLSAPARELSGGERQRLLLARTIARRRPWVLLDEPLGALDAQDRMQVARVLVEELGDRGAVIVTHDRDEAAVLGEVLAVLIDGKIRQVGPVAEVFAQPAGAEVAATLGIANLADGTVQAVDGPLCAVGVGGQTVWGVGDQPDGSHVRVFFAAESVTVFGSTDQSAGSARNRWVGTVEEIRPAGRLVEVVVDAGLPVVALLTPGSLEALSLQVGSEVAVAVKATSVRVVPA